MLNVSPLNAINFASKKQYKVDEDQKEFYFENGRAYSKDGKPFFGRYRHKNAQGDEYILLYKDGDLKVTSKNHKVHKKYSYKTPPLFDL